VATVAIGDDGGRAVAQERNRGRKAQRVRSSFVSGV